MKKLFAILLTLTMVLGLCSFACAEGIDEALIAAAKEKTINVSTSGAMTAANGWTAR